MDINDPFRPHLERAFNYAADAAAFQESTEALKPKQGPLTFHDRHISANLLCRRVVDFPQIEQVLSQVSDDAISRYHAEGNKFPVAGYTALAKESPFAMIGHLENARNMNSVYKRGAGHFSGLFASKFFHSEVPWSFIFELVWNFTENDFISESTLDIFPDRLATKIQGAAPNQSNFPNRGSSDTIQVLKAAQAVFPHTALWHFFPRSPTGNLIVQRVSRGLFLWETSTTKGIKNIPTNEIPEDTRGCPWNPESHKLGLVPSSQRKTKTLSGTSSQRGPRHINVTRKPNRAVKSRVDVNQYIQHAWARAVETDSTFIILNCGTYERIGIRHRASQTLYISPLINPAKCRDPAYGKLHIGLHTAIAEDMTERFLKALDKSRKATIRPAAEEGQPPPKRFKASHSNGSQVDFNHNSESMKHLLAREIQERQVALITLKYGVYCSPVPATFLRIENTPAHGTLTNQTKFRPSECLELVLDAPFGDGSASFTHPANLSITLESGEVLHHDLVVKLAFSPKQRNKLVKEYRVYKYMNEVGVSKENLVTVYGLFDDQDSDTLALVMDYGGRSLRQLYQSSTLTPQDHIIRQFFTSTYYALHNIHRVGVRHRDLRPDKILIDGLNAVKIVGFGCANFDEGWIDPRLYAKELSLLRASFKGWHDDPEFWDPDSI